MLYPMHLSSLLSLCDLEHRHTHCTHSRNGLKDKGWTPCSNPLSQIVIKANPWACSAPNQHHLDWPWGVRRRNGTSRCTHCPGGLEQQAEGGPCPGVSIAATSPLIDKCSIVAPRGLLGSLALPCPRCERLHMLSQTGYIPKGCEPVPQDSEAASRSVNKYPTWAALERAEIQMNITTQHFFPLNICSCYFSPPPTSQFYWKGGQRPSQRKNLICHHLILSIHIYVGDEKSCQWQI